MNMETTPLKNKKENWLFRKACETKNTKFHLESQAVGRLPYSLSDCGRGRSSVKDTARVTCPALSLRLVSLTLTSNQSLPREQGACIRAPPPRAPQSPSGGWGILHPKTQRLGGVSAGAMADHSLQGQSTSHNHTLSLDERAQGKSDTRYFPMK